MLSLNSSDSHNSFYVKHDITSYYENGSLWNRIAGTNGYDEMEGLFPGCYFDLPTKIHAIDGGDSHAGFNRILVLGCNCRWNQGDTNDNYINYNHIVCAAYSSFGKSHMNSTNTTTGGYANSKMNTTILGSPAIIGDLNGTINQQLYYYFTNHLKTYRECLSAAVDINYENMYHEEKGACKTWQWFDVQCVLMSEAEVYGTNVWSGSGWDTACAKSQYPVFRFREGNLNNRLPFTLRNVISQSRFALSNILGSATISLASDVSHVRPRFILA